MSHTHLGSKQLHDRHSVMVEGGSVPRSRVMDQTAIDRLLMDGHIDLHEFRAGEYMLQQAQIAQMWAKGANLMGTGGSKPGSRIPFGSLRFGNPLKSVRDRFGWFHAHLLTKVIVDNYDAAKDPMKLKCLKQSLRHISDAWLGNRDPLRHLRKVA